MIFRQGVNGQGYIPLVETNKTWSTLNNMPDFQFTYWTKFSDDTIINGTRYNKVIISDTIPSPAFSPNENIVGFVREDTIFKRVYFMNAIFQEGLIYDFGANIGDTIHIHNKCFYFPGSPVSSYFEDSVIVDTIFITSVIPSYEDTFSHIINLFDNINRKVIVLKGTNNYYFDVWIEGIGSIFGIMESRSSNNNYFPGRVLLCYSEDNFLIYYNPEFNSCVFHSLNIKEHSMNFKIYPNPMSDFFIIENSNHNGLNFHIEVFDIFGNLFLEDNLYCNTSRINVKCLKSGVYFLRISTENSISSHKLLIVKE
jgi:hypothetical protein